jgi:hypothetical protein
MGEPNSRFLALTSKSLKFSFSNKASEMTLLAQVTAQTQTIAQSGIGLGSVIAVVCSWQRNRSILWAILAGIFSWFYVLYFAASRKPNER